MLLRDSKCARIYTYTFWFPMQLIYVNDDFLLDRAVRTMMAFALAVSDVMFSLCLLYFKLIDNKEMGFRWSSCSNRKYFENMCDATHIESVVCMSW